MVLVMQWVCCKVCELVKMVCFDYFLMLMYCGFMVDCECVVRDWKVFVCCVCKDLCLVCEGDVFYFVVVIEYYKSGGIYIYVGVCGWCDVIVLCDVWYVVVGKGEGNVDI